MRHINYLINLSEFLEGDMRKEEMKRGKMKRRGTLKLDIKIDYYSYIRITKC